MREVVPLLLLLASASAAPVPLDQFLPTAFPRLPDASTDPRELSCSLSDSPSEYCSVFPDGCREGDTCTDLVVVRHAGDSTEADSMGEGGTSGDVIVQIYMQVNPAEIAQTVAAVELQTLTDPTSTQMIGCRMHDLSAVVAVRGPGDETSFLEVPWLRGILVDRSLTTISCRMRVTAGHVAIPRRGTPVRIHAGVIDIEPENVRTRSRIAGTLRSKTVESSTIEERAEPIVIEERPLRLSVADDTKPSSTSGTTTAPAPDQQPNLRELRQPDQSTGSRRQTETAESTPEIVEATTATTHKSIDQAAMNPSASPLPSTFPSTLPATASPTAAPGLVHQLNEERSPEISEENRTGEAPGKQMTEEERAIEEEREREEEEIRKIDEERIMEEEETTARLPNLRESSQSVPPSPVAHDDPLQISGSRSEVRLEGETEEHEDGKEETSGEKRAHGEERIEKMSGEKRDDPRKHGGHGVPMRPAPATEEPPSKVDGLEEDDELTEDEKQIVRNVESGKGNKAFDNSRDVAMDPLGRPMHKADENPTEEPTKEVEEVVDDDDDEEKKEEEEKVVKPEGAVDDEERKAASSLSYLIPLLLTATWIAL